MILVQFFSVVAYSRILSLLPIFISCSPPSLYLSLSPSLLSHSTAPPPPPHPLPHLRWSSVSLMAVRSIASLPIWGLFRVVRRRKEIQPSPTPPSINDCQSKTPKPFPVKALQLEPLINDHLLKRQRPLFGPDFPVIFHCF